MPNEIRVNPAATSSASPAASIESGLDSVVTSASSVSPNRSRIAPSIRARSAGGNSVGVPPPTKTVEIGGASAPSTRRARSSSAMAWSTYRSRLTPGPSSRAV